MALMVVSSSQSASFERTRTKQALAILAPTLLLATGILALQIYNRVDFENYILPLIFILAAAVQAWRLRYRMADVPLGTVVEIIPLTVRYRNVRTALAWTMGLIIICWLSSWSNGHFADAWWYPLPVTISILAFYSVHALITDTRIVLTAQGTAEQARLAESRRNNPSAFGRFFIWMFETIFEKWWLRYPLAGLLFYFAYQFYIDPKPDSKAAAAWIAIAALFIARRVMGVIIGVSILCGIIYLIFGAIAALPVSVAIIIGALIIAGAMQSR